MLKYIKTTQAEQKYWQPGTKNTNHEVEEQNLQENM